VGVNGDVKGTQVLKEHNPLSHSTFAFILAFSFVLAFILGLAPAFIIVISLVQIRFLKSRMPVKMMN
jgi:hypothetical protein